MSIICLSNYIDLMYSLSVHDMFTLHVFVVETVTAVFWTVLFRPEFVSWVCTHVASKLIAVLSKVHTRLFCKHTCDVINHHTDHVILFSRYQNIIDRKLILQMFNCRESGNVILSTRQHQTSIKLVCILI